MAEYLRYKSDQPEANLSLDQLIQMGMILSPGFLFNELSKAKTFLQTAQGPNLGNRETDWLEHWIYLFRSETNVDLIKSSRIVTTKKLGKIFKEKNDSNQITGIIPMATGDGTFGHFNTLRIMLERVTAVGILLEGPNYFQQHPKRRRPFLPIAIRASMYINYDQNNIYISQIPIRRDDLPESVHYFKLFKNSHALIHFVSSNDLNYDQKISRMHKEYRHLATIPEFPTYHTSDMVMKLHP